MSLIPRSGKKTSHRNSKDLLGPGWEAAERDLPSLSFLPEQRRISRLPRCLPKRRQTSGDSSRTRSFGNAPLSAWHTSTPTRELLADFREDRLSLGQRIQTAPPNV